MWAIWGEIHKYSFQRVSDKESLSSFPVGTIQILEGCFQVSVEADFKMIQKSKEKDHNYHPLSCFSKLE